MAGGCGDDGPSTSNAVAEASTCEELRDAYDIDSLTDEDAELVGERLVSLAEADFAEDRVLDDKLACNSVIRDLDPNHSSAVAGIDLEEMELFDGKARNG